MKKIIALTLALFTALWVCAAGAEVTGDRFVGLWTATPETLSGAFELPEDTEQTIVIEIVKLEEYFDITITWTTGATEKVSWTLNGNYDEDNEALYGYGVKSRQTLSAGGDLLSSETENDEVNAEFTFDDEGNLCWRDEDEGIDGTAFVPAEGAGK